MIEIFPSYYHKFKCISSECKHNCCIGWEIDIDEDTFDKYKNMSSDIGHKIRSNIDGDPPHFVLEKNDRCPMLCDNGLCEIISSCGEDALCEICAEHPRFRNFYSSFTETGLGLCCEEAARIIVSEKEKFCLPLSESLFLLDEEEAFISERAEIFRILQNRNQSIGKRFSKLSEKFGFKLDFSMHSVSETYMKLEHLCDDWTQELELLGKSGYGPDCLDNPCLQLALEQLACYFVFRHLGDAAWDGDYASRIKFMIVSCAIIAAICDMKSEDNNISTYDIAEIARMYSSEIEYSEENTEKLITVFSSDSIL